MSQVRLDFMGRVSPVETEEGMENAGFFQFRMVTISWIK